MTRGRLRLACALFLVVCLLSPLASVAAPFSYNAQNEPLADFLCVYAASQDKSCSVSPKITGTITGNLEFRTPDAFFAFLERSRDVITYQEGNTIHYYDRSQMESATLPLHRITVAKISSTLREMRAFDSRYPLRPVNNGRMLRLTAPPAYVALVTSLTGELEASFAAAKSARVFKLKHAWADDVELTFMDKQTTIPGVATLLRRITAEGTNAPGVVSGEEHTGGGSVERLRGKGLLQKSGTQVAAKAEQRAAEARRDSSRAAAQSVAARILADPRLNAVIIWDDEELMPFYETMIRELDQPVDLVEIRAAIVDVSVERLMDLGISWFANVPIAGNRRFGAFGGANTPAGTDFFSATGAGLNLTTIYRYGLDEFMARVSALEEDGDASVLSRPAVLTMDNIQASLEATSTYYIEVGGYQEVDLFDVTYGTVLRVTPHIVRNEAAGTVSIKLSVHVEDGGATPPIDGSGLKYPSITKTRVNTQAMVGNRQALIIGGHYYESSSTGDAGIPGFKNIPLLGSLFKRQNDRFRKYERLFIISPRLVDAAVVQQDTEKFGELFDRTMMTQPAEYTERTRGGCARQRRTSERPLPIPSPPPVQPVSSTTGAP